ncbi:MAG: radical SAM protein [Deltaproteobacteria bacterium]|nr:radical SAM protein [Deltaproteobacteria bacterium]
MKILVLEPPAVSKYGNQRIYGGNGGNKSDFRKAPVDVMWISGYLRSHGFENTFHDANNSREKIQDVEVLLKKLNPDIIFLSTSTCTLYKDMEVAALVKRLNPECLTVAMGTHLMALTEETMRDFPDLDAGIYTNEWEQSALSIAQNRSNLPDAHGIMYRSGDGQLIKTRPSPPLRHFDDLGFPAHDKLRKEIYHDPTMKRFPKTMVQFSRACIAKCNFCCQPAFFGTVMPRSVDSIIDEMKWVSKLGFREIFLNDPTFTYDHKWNMEIFERVLSEGIDLTWWCTTRAHCLNKDILKMMKRTGCHTIGIGMESADDQVLKNIKKGTRREIVYNAVKMTREAGIDALVFCVFGFPGETHESMRETLAFLKTLPASFITLGIAVPAPGTPHYQYMEENGLLKHKQWDLYDPLREPVYDYPHLSGKEIYDFAHYGLRQFYLRPSYIWDRVKSIHSFSELGTYASNFFGFMKRYVFRVTA